MTRTDWSTSWPGFAAFHTKSLPGLFAKSTIRSAESRGGSLASPGELVEPHPCEDLLVLWIAFQRIADRRSMKKQELTGALIVGFFELLVKLDLLAETGIEAHHLDRCQVPVCRRVL